MDKKNVIFLLVGGAIGAAAGYYFGKKVASKYDVEEDSTPVEHGDILPNEKEDKPTEEEVKAYEQKLYEMRYEADQDLIHEEEAEESPKTRSMRRKPKILGENEVDPDDPDLRFESEVIYYYTESDTILDADGQPVDETDSVGNDLRRIGWMTNDDADDIWVRNYQRGIDYLLVRKECSVMDDYDTGEELDSEDDE